jgi:hypothetical protein
MMETAVERRMSNVQRAARAASDLLERLSVLSPEDRDSVINLIRNDPSANDVADALTTPEAP